MRLTLDVSSIVQSDGVSRVPGARYNPMVFDRRVAVRHIGAARYPEFPFDPPRRYPEFSNFETSTDSTNRVYEALRNVLADLDLDQSNFDRAGWNPLRTFIRAGQRILIKPNWVLHANQSDGSIESLVTHTSLIRATMDYVLIALDQEGTIEVADAPLQNCDFDELLRRSCIVELLDEYRKRFPGVTFSIFDLRKTILYKEQAKILRFHRVTSKNGDPRGYTTIDLGQESFLTDIQHNYKRFRVANYNHQMMHAHQNEENHEYLISNSILSADFIINLPKLKCHIKAGITGALKNLIGINGHKEYLPHHTNGYPSEATNAGDQYPSRSILKPLINRLQDEYWKNLGSRGAVSNKVLGVVAGSITRLSKAVDRDHSFDGGWSGNETIPRTTLDLNHVLYFYDVNAGSLSRLPLRNILHIVDGVVAGEGYGPLHPAPKAAGVVLGGWNPLLVDICGAQLIGLDPMRVPLLRYGVTHEKSRLWSSNSSTGGLDLIEDGQRRELEHLASLDFQIPKEWKDAVMVSL